MAQSPSAAAATIEEIKKSSETTQQGLIISPLPVITFPDLDTIQARVTARPEHYAIVSRSVKTDKKNEYVSKNKNFLPENFNPSTIYEIGRKLLDLPVVADEAPEAKAERLKLRRNKAIVVFQNAAIYQDKSNELMAKLALALHYGYGHVVTPTRKSHLSMAVDYLLDISAHQHFKYYFRTPEETYSLYYTILDFEIKNIIESKDNATTKLGLLQELAQEYLDDANQKHSTEVDEGRGFSSEPELFYSFAKHCCGVALQVDTSSSAEEKIKEEISELINKIGEAQEARKVYTNPKSSALHESLSAALSSMTVAQPIGKVLPTQSSSETASATYSSTSSSTLSVAFSASSSALSALSVSTSSAPSQSLGSPRTLSPTPQTDPNKSARYLKRWNKFTQSGSGSNSTVTSPTAPDPTSSSIYFPSGGSALSSPTAGTVSESQESLAHPTTSTYDLNGSKLK